MGVKFCSVITTYHRPGHLLLLDHLQCFKLAGFYIGPKQPTPRSPTTCMWIRKRKRWPLAESNSVSIYSALRLDLLIFLSANTQLDQTRSPQPNLHETFYHQLAIIGQYVRGFLYGGELHRRIFSASSSTVVSQTPSEPTYYAFTSNPSSNSKKQYKH